MASFIKEASRREVSCRIARMILKFAEARQVQAEKMLRGTGTNLPYLFDTTNWVSEKVISKLLENLSSFMKGEDAALIAGKDVKVLSDDDILDLIFSVSSNPITFYRSLPKWHALHFKTSDLRIVKEEEGSIVFHLQARQDKTPGSAILKWIEGMMAAGSAAFDLPEAEVLFRPAADEPAMLHRISVSWRSSPGNVAKEVKVLDEKKAGLLVRKIIRRLDQSESRWIDFDRFAFLLKESEGRFRTFFDNVMDSVFIVDEGGFIIEANRKALDMLGFRRSELVGMPAAKLVHEQDEVMIMGLLRLAREGKPIPVVEIDLRRDDGGSVPVQASVSAVVWPETGALFKVLVTVKDLSMLRKSEEEAKRMRDLNEIIVSSMLEGIFVEDREGVCKFANPRMEEMLGYSPGEMTGSHWSRFVPDEFVGPIEEELAKRKLGIKSSYEACFEKRDGSKIRVKVGAVPLFEEGSFAGVLSVITDLGDVRKIVG